MKNYKISILTCAFTFLFINQSFSQDRIYTENSNEMIFSFADVVYNGQNLSTPARFSLFFHAGNNIHFDLNDYVGIYTGYGLRNIGFITEENNVKMKRRTYSIGVPLALKLGIFQKKLFVYGGGSYEMFFHYKQKQFIDGNKQKYSEWFSDRTDRFAPSFFAGIQFLGGINLKFKYYPNNFLNTSFVGTDFGESVDYGDYSKTNLFYVGLSFNFDPKNMGININSDKKSEKVAYFSE
ncbi:MAG: hypothetical protein KAS71_17625 [Bacteroidales bacterium]|nr:hypothetical protein [Bacteroidales bacterium]